MNKNRQKALITLIAAGVLTILNGCAGSKIKDPTDPWAGWNRGAQAFNDRLDKYIMKPVAQGYQDVMPDLAHHAVTNFFSNIDDIGVLTNDSLQGEFLQSGQDTARLLVNTTAGVGGLIDVGSMIDLPKHTADFDQTLGKWGVDAGPYLVLPFFGPSSPRGLAGLLGDLALNPISYTGIYFSNDMGMAYAVSGGLGALKAIDTRSNNLGLEKVINEAAMDRYEFIKNAYIARRKYLVNGRTMPEEDDVLKYLDSSKENNMAPVPHY
ncbi:MAG: VacJ family lipoprotein [Methylococcales bacterium]|nr:VacJ family lipoprotein [Methylococcales bacterium]